MSARRFAPAAPGGRLTSQCSRPLRAVITFVIGTVTAGIIPGIDTAGGGPVGAAQAAPDRPAGRDARVADTAPAAPDDRSSRRPAPPRTAGPAARESGADVPLLGTCPIGLGPRVLDGELPALRRRIEAGGPLRIVTLGSSSTAGSGASSMRYFYPSQLAVELLHRFPGVTIEVINSGIGGEEIDQMAARIERDVLFHRPDLVIWQFGSNAVIRRYPLGPIEPLARDGVARILASGAELILMDLQHVPRIEAAPDRQAMLDLIHAVAGTTDAVLFRRYDLMRSWHETLGEDYRRMFAADALHMNDTSYFCMAAALAAAIHEGATGARSLPRAR